MCLYLVPLNLDEWRQNESEEIEIQDDQNINSLYLPPSSQTFCLDFFFLTTKA